MIGGKKKYYLFFIVFLLIVIVGYRYSSKRIELFGHYDKVWAHRVNDLDKLASTENKFPGIELDLVYDNQQKLLWVTHGKITQNTENFEQYLSQLNAKKLQLWLDIKNLRKENAEEIFRCLEKAVKKGGLANKRKNILIESTDISSLPLFQKKGFRISWYITEVITKNNKAAMLARISEKLIHYPAVELSSNYHNYLFLNEVFPERTKNVWILTSTYDWETFKNYRTIRSILNDNTVKTVLIPYINFNRHY